MGTTQGIIIEYKRSPRGMGKAWRSYTKMAIEATLLYWWNKILPKHFKMAAFVEYGYQQRTKGYLKRKARVRHHQLPNVWTGNLRNLMAHRRPDLKATATNGAAKFRGLPRYAYVTDTFQKVGSGKKTRVVLVRRPNKVKELTATSRRDFMAMLKQYDDTLGRLLKKHKDGAKAA